VKGPGAPAALIVVGGGIGGAASALRAAQYHLPTVWILGDRETSRASRAAYVANIDNMIGVHPGIVQDKAAGILRANHPEAASRLEAEHLHITTLEVVANARRRIESGYADHVRLIDDRAVGASRPKDAFRVRVAGGDEFEAPCLLLATGVMDRQPVVRRTRGGRDLAGIHWVFPYANHETFLYCIRCEGHLAAGRRVAVLGGGDGAAEVALTLRERYGVEVSILTAGDPITWSADRGRLLAALGITVRPGHLEDIHGGDRGAALGGFALEGGVRVEADLAFVAMGLHRVYNDLARALGADLETGDAPPERRHVLIDWKGETSVRGLFAVGDMAQRRDEPVMKQVYTAQEYAVRAVDAVDRRRRTAARRAAEASGGLPGPRA
jgi:thioredoxin reductase